MSRIGKLPIPVPSGVEVTISGQDVTVKGPKGTLSHTVVEPITIEQSDGQPLVKRPNDERDAKARARPDPHPGRQHGRRRHRGLLEDARDRRHRLPRAGQGQRPGVRARVQPPGHRRPPDGISFTVEAPTRFVVTGIDKQKVGETAANIRKIRKPEPYKGKGVRYQGEVVRRKAGKAGK